MRSSELVLLLASCATCAALVKVVPKLRAQRRCRSPRLCSDATPNSFFRFRKLDHVVLRCKNVETMQNWYLNVLGAAPEWLNRFDGALSHVRVGDSLIDLVAMDCSLAFAKGEPRTESSALDHIAINVRQLVSISWALLIALLCLLPLPAASTLQPRGRAPPRQTVRRFRLRGGQGVSRLLRHRSHQLGPPLRSRWPGLLTLRAGPGGQCARAQVPARGPQASAFGSGAEQLMKKQD